MNSNSSQFAAKFSFHNFLLQRHFGSEMHLRNMNSLPSKLQQYHNTTIQYDTIQYNTIILQYCNMIILQYNTIQSSVFDHCSLVQISLIRVLMKLAFDLSQKNLFCRDHKLFLDILFQDSLFCEIRTKRINAA